THAEGGRTSGFSQSARAAPGGGGPPTSFWPRCRSAGRKNKRGAGRGVHLAASVAVESGRGRRCGSTATAARLVWALFDGLFGGDARGGDTTGDQDRSGPPGKYGGRGARDTRRCSIRHGEDTRRPQSTALV